MPKVIQLTQGYETVVDDMDYPRLASYRWKILRAGKKIYAVRTVKTPGSRINDLTLLVHREIMPGGVRTDRIDGNGLNNQRVNLRHATASENAANSPLIVRGTSRYKGVYWNKKDRRWQAQIGNGRSESSGFTKTKYLGQFTSEYDAALAYDSATRQRFGAYAVLNFV